MDDFLSLPIAIPWQVPRASGAWFVTDEWNKLADCGMSVDLSVRVRSFKYSDAIRRCDLFLRVKPYDASFTPLQAVELLRNLKNGNRA